jgi:hypothetical protein
MRVNYPAFHTVDQRGSRGNLSSFVHTVLLVRRCSARLGHIQFDEMTEPAPDAQAGPPFYFGARRVLISLSSSSTLSSLSSAWN